MKEFGPLGYTCLWSPLGSASALERILSETGYPYQFQNFVISLFMRIIA